MKSYFNNDREASSARSVPVAQFGRTAPLCGARRRIPSSPSARGTGLLAGGGERAQNCAGMRFLRTISRLAPWVLGSAALSVYGLWLFRKFVSVAALSASNDAVGSYLQTLGGIYAVLLGFVVLVVWQQFNDARGAVEREANEVVDLFRIGQGLPDGAREVLHDRLLRYVDSVLEHEWSYRACIAVAGVNQVAEQLNAAWFALRSHEPHTDNQRALQSEALNCFNELSNARTARLTASRLRIPSALRVLLYLGAFIVVACTYLLAVQSFVIHAVMTGGLAGAVSHVMYVVEDLDDCFSGDWQIPKEAFERARRTMIAHAAP